MNSKSFFLFTLLFFSIAKIKAQNNEIIIGNAYFNNGNILSGLELSYFRTIEGNYAMGIRSGLQFEHNTIPSLSKKNWSVSILSRFKTGSHKRISTFIESGLSFFRVRKMNFLAVRPVESTLLMVPEKSSYTGFTLGATINYRISKHFQFGINYRSYLIFPIDYKNNKSTKFESFPVSTLIYTF